MALSTFGPASALPLLWQKIFENIALIRFKRVVMLV